MTFGKPLFYGAFHADDEFEMLGGYPIDLAHFAYAVEDVLRQSGHPELLEKFEQFEREALEAYVKLRLARTQIESRTGSEKEEDPGPPQ